jgi:cell division protein FtsZ
MTINLSVPQPDSSLKPRITVIGVGGAGGNAVNNMIDSSLDGVEFLVTNTDAQALAQSHAERRIQLGSMVTHGLGAGSRPDVGRAAAEETMDELVQQLQGQHMVFITAGMGGGTGTGAAPVIARLAREHGILTVGVVTKPFQFEGSHRMRVAEAGIEEMQQYVDTLIVIPNQNLFRIANEKTTFAEAFTMADEVLHSGVRGVTDLMVVPGLINLDFADIRAVMGEMGKAMMGTGEAEGESRARAAAESAISNPLLDEVSMKGARGVLINITGGADMTLFEVDEAANRIGDEVDPEANIIFGSSLDPSLDGRLRVSVVATGIDVDAMTQPRPILRVLPQPEPVADKSVADDLPAAAPMPGAAETSGPPGAARPDLPAAMRGEAGQGADATAETGLEAAEEDAVAAQPALAVGGGSRMSIPGRPGGNSGSTIERAGRPAPQHRVQPQPHVQPPARPQPQAQPPAQPQGQPQPQTAAPATDAFIPPRPVDPRARGEAVKSPDPYSTAAMLNGGAKREERRSLSDLFSKMTGAGRAQKAEEARARAAASEPAEAPRRAEPRIAPPKPPAPQPSFDEVDARERSPAPPSEEDLLDIPAFLRRQAN